MPATATKEKCGGCGRMISSNEVPYLWDEATVCHACWERLRAMREEKKEKKLIAVPPPNFGAVVVLCTIFRVLGAVACIAGAVAAFLLGTPENGHTTASPAAAMGVFAAGLISGVMLMGLSELLACIRHMAINSFYIRNQTAA